MIVDKKDIDYFVSSFKKSFESFCQKLPLFLKSPIITNKEVILHKYEYDPKEDKYNEEKILNYEFDFTQNVKTNIYRIKQILMEKYFLIMKEIRKYEVEATTEEINDLIYKNIITLNEVTSIGYIKKSIIMWRIEKIISTQDEINVRNLNTDEVTVFKLKMPSTAVLSKISEEKDLEKRWVFFQSKVKSSFVLNKNKGEKIKHYDKKF